MLSSVPAFLRRQQRDWRVTVTRTSLDRLAYQAVSPYLSIFIVALGATAIQLGAVISIGMVIAGLSSLFIGWSIDRVGPKRIYLLGIGMVAIAYLTYGLAQDWRVTVVAMVAYWLGFSAATNGCATICGNCLANEDRATGMMVCETVGAGLLGMAGPLVGAGLVAVLGGVSVDGIRPLFFLCLVISLGTFALVWTQLSDLHWRRPQQGPPHVLRDLTQVLKDGRHLKRWLLVGSLGGLPIGMIFPFSQVYAHQVKGADEFVLGAMVAGAALASIIFAIPLGRLADKVGRKKVLYISIPVFWLSNLMLVWAPNLAWVIFAGILQGFFYIGGPIAAAMERELVPPDQMGRWLGITRSSRLLTNALLTFLAGLVWDKVGPQYVFLAYVGLDLAVRMPLLISMPETLFLRLGSQRAP